MSGDLHEERDAPELLSTAALTVFRLNGQFLGLAEELARPAGLTAAWWQVLGAAVGQPQPVAAIARTMGLARQSVQRIADLLVERGLAEYHVNPAHARAKLVVVTDAGREAIAAIAPDHALAAKRLVAELGPDADVVVAALERLAGAMDRLEAGSGRGERG